MNLTVNNNDGEQVGLHIHVNGVEINLHGHRRATDHNGVYRAWIDMPRDRAADLFRAALAVLEPRTFEPAKTGEVSTEEASQNEPPAPDGGLERAIRMAARLPREAWAGVPRDGASNHDAYLAGMSTAEIARGAAARRILEKHRETFQRLADHDRLGGLSIEDLEKEAVELGRDPIRTTRKVDEITADVERMGRELDEDERQP